MLSARQDIILRIIIKEHIDTASPVASDNVARLFPSKISSATIRNDMVSLEDLGYIHQPYHSGGRVPSDKGYLYYIESLASNSELPLSEQHLIRHQFHQAKKDIDEWGKLAATVLSRTVQNVAVVALPKPIRSKFKHMELISIHETIALLILVMQEANIKQQMIYLTQEASQAELSDMAHKLRATYSGLTAEQIKKVNTPLSPVETQIAATIVESMQQEDRIEYEEIYIDGIRHFFDQPEFSMPEKMRDIIEILEAKSFLSSILLQALIDDGIGIVIGKDNKENAMQSCSVIAGKYGIPGQLSGAMGVLGPTRMQYERSISAVRCLSTIMNEFLNDLYGQPGGR
ncbi:heat-inducible transcriptional repressor HrcA [Chloroflexota bacterium]